MLEQFLTDTLSLTAIPVVPVQEHTIDIIVIAKEVEERVTVRTSKQTESHVY